MNLKFYQVLQHIQSYLYRELGYLEKSMLVEDGSLKIRSAKWGKIIAQNILILASTRKVRSQSILGVRS